MDGCKVAKVVEMEKVGEDGGYRDIDTKLVGTNAKNHPSQGKIPNIILTLIWKDYRVRLFFHHFFLIFISVINRTPKV